MTSIKQENDSFALNYIQQNIKLILLSVEQFWKMGTNTKGKYFVQPKSSVSINNIIDWRDENLDEGVIDFLCDYSGNNGGVLKVKQALLCYNFAKSAELDYDLMIVQKDKKSVDSMNLKSFISFKESRNNNPKPSGLFFVYGNYECLSVCYYSNQPDQDGYFSRVVHQ